MTLYEAILGWMKLLKQFARTKFLTQTISVISDNRLVFKPSYILKKSQGGIVS